MSRPKEKQMPPRLPSRPSHDADRLSVSWVSQLLDCVKYAMEYPIGDRKSIMRTPSGTLQTISQNSSNNQNSTAGTGSYPCQITGGTTADGYTCNIYADGKNQPATGSGTIEPLELLWGDNIPVGTWVIGHTTTVTVTGGTQ